MAILRIIFLLLSSLLLLSGCAYNKITNEKTISETILVSEKLMPVIPDSGAAKYKTEIDVLNKHFTGIILFKKVDALNSHIVFVTELGMRMFEFVVNGDSIKPVYIFDALNKPNAVKLLTESFAEITLIPAKGKMAKIKQNGMFVLNTKSGLLAITPCPNSFAGEATYFSGKKKQSLILYQNNYENIKFKRKALVGFKITLQKIKG